MEKVIDVKGRKVLVRRPVPDDAPAMLAMVGIIAREGVYFLVEPEDLRNEEQQRERIAKIDPEKEGWFVAFVDGEFAGFVDAKREALGKVRHVAGLGIGLNPRFRGMGIGTLLMQEIEEWARSIGVKKLTLGVFATNTVARRLYEKCGYELEGIQRRHFLIRGEYVDDVVMAKWLD